MTSESSHSKNRWKENACEQTRVKTQGWVQSVFPLEKGKGGVLFHHQKLWDHHGKNIHGMETTAKKGFDQESLKRLAGKSPCYLLLFLATKWMNELSIHIHINKRPLSLKWLFTGIQFGG